MSELLDLALVFFRIGMLAFGGGFAILPEMERVVVEQRGWLTHREFVDSFAMGMFTPGPGMLMVMFTGYKVAGLPGALVALGATFVPPAFLIWLIAGRWDQIRGSPWLNALQRGFMPIALGLVASGTYTLLRSAVTDSVSAVITILAVAALWKWRLNPALVILPGGALALAWHGLARLLSQIG